MEEQTYRRGKTGYIIEAALEYLISILVTGSFLATLTAQLGLADGLTGVLSSFISLGCLFQLLSMALHRPRMKRFVVWMSLLNQLLFMLLFFVPLLGFPKPVKTAVFIGAILAAYILYNIAHPKKIYWLMSLIRDKERGIFTAQKEMISLASGIVFSFGMGAVVDHYRDAGNPRAALLVCGATVFVLMLAHTATMLLTPEKPQAAPAEQGNPLRSASRLLRDPSIRRVIGVFILWYIAQYSAIPFYGTYQIHELGFSLKLVSLITVVTSVVRICFSRLWGRCADKTSFAAMMHHCLLIMCAAFFAAAFAAPATGLVAFGLYAVFSGIANAGVNSALINLVYDYVDTEQRADALALCQAFAGLVGFLATLVLSPLVTAVQRLSPTLFGRPVYAQQLLSLLALLMTAVTALCVHRLPQRQKVSAEA